MDDNLPDKPNDDLSAPRARLLDLTDSAIDTLEEALETGEEKLKVSVAQDILDRNGLSKQQALAISGSSTDIPAEALVQLVKGLSHVFGADEAASAEPRDITFTKEKEPDRPTFPKQAEERTPEPPDERQNEEKTGENASKKGKTAGLPDELLHRYGSKA
jgi:hypothetical protein